MPHLWSRALLPGRLALLISLTLLSFELPPVGMQIRNTRYEVNKKIELVWWLLPLPIYLTQRLTDHEAVLSRSCLITKLPYHEKRIPA